MWLLSESFLWRPCPPPPVNRCRTSNVLQGAQTFAASWKFQISTSAVSESIIPACPLLFSLCLTFLWMQQTRQVSQLYPVDPCLPSLSQFISVFPIFFCLSLFSSLSLFSQCFPVYLCFPSLSQFFLFPCPDIHPCRPYG